MSEQANIVQMPGQAAFDDFWRAFPKRVGKAKARALWDKITNSGLQTRTLEKDSGTYIELELKATPEEIIEGAKRYAETQTDPRPYHFGLRDDGKYTCHPATWLNQGRWEDDV